METKSTGTELSNPENNNDSSGNRASNISTSDYNHPNNEDKSTKCEGNCKLKFPWIRPTEVFGDVPPEGSDETGAHSNQRAVGRFTKKKKKILIQGSRRGEIFEKDKDVLKRRTKQIDYGKNTIGYQTYLAAVPKETRTKEHPRTPNKYLKFSRRSWEKQIRKWRKNLHYWDPPHEDPEIPECDILDLAASLSEITGIQDSFIDNKASESSTSVTSDSSKSDTDICYSSENIQELVSSCQAYHHGDINFENVHTPFDALYPNLETNVENDDSVMHTIENFVLELKISGDFEPV